MTETARDRFLSAIKELNQVALDIRNGKNSMPEFENISIGSLNLSRVVTKGDVK